MSINPQLYGDYITTFNIRQIQNVPDLWGIVSEYQIQNSAKAELMVYTALLQINNLKFLQNEKLFVKSIFADKSTFINFCKPFVELKSSIQMTSSVEKDLENLFDAVKTGWINPDARCVTTRIINKYKQMIELNDKYGFVYALESFVRASATNNKTYIYDVDNIDYTELTPHIEDALSILLYEETEAELEAMGITEDDVEEVRTSNSLFDDLEVKNLRRAGNQYPLKKAKKVELTGSLFDLGGAA